MKIGIITIFPKMFYGFIRYGIVGRSVKNNILSINIWNPRAFTQNKYHKIDDKPYGGEPGMLMAIQPIKYAINAAKKKLEVLPQLFIYLRRVKNLIKNMYVIWRMTKKK